MPKPIVAICSPNAKPETFVQAHIDLLDADIKLLYGGYRPQFSKQYGALVGQHFLAKTLRRMGEILQPKGWLTLHEKAIAAFLEKEKVEVVLAEYGVAGAKVYRACRAANVPLIVYFFGFDAHQHQTIARYKEDYLQMFQYATFIAAVSQHICDKLILLGAPPEKVVYSPCAPNTAFFACKPKLQSNNLIAVGRFVPKKSPETTIRAFAQILKEFPHIQLKMAGNGPLFAHCQALVKTLGIENNVHLPGPITPADMQHWFQDAIAFVQHSVTAPDGDMEGTPVAILEASAAALPILSTLHSGIPEVVKNGETGILVPEHDVDAFANAMRTLVENPAKSHQMGLSGRQYVLDNFSMEKHIGTINQLIQRCIQPQ